MFRILSLITVVVLTGLAWMWFGPLTSHGTTYAIAEGAFFGLTKQMGIDVSDFDSPPELDLSDESRMIVLEWTSKSRPGCRIEVDIDRRYANARPTWSCNPSSIESKN